ncbi:hypothetical protein AB0F91_41285 [Amycolatopsis sp. NPDC023774]|uniref:hypothetical protein n=1 Tax=Amycolatopsis sp. NPDC023774 TaxID=3155015 RepID=UPI0033F87F08
MDDPGRDYAARAGAEPFASPDQIRVAQAAAAAAPHAAAPMTEHLSDHGELLPTRYFDTLGVWYLATWRRRDADPDQFTQARAVAAVLDTELWSDPGSRTRSRSASWRCSPTCPRPNRPPPRRPAARPARRVHGDGRLAPQLNRPRRAAGCRSAYLGWSAGLMAEYSSMSTRRPLISWWLRSRPSRW